MRSKEEDFTISDYPLLQTEFLYDSKTGIALEFRIFDSFNCYTDQEPTSARDKFDDEKNRQFDYSMFHFMKGYINLFFYESIVHE